MSFTSLIEKKAKPACPALGLAERIRDDGKPEEADAFLDVLNKNDERGEYAFTPNAIVEAGKDLGYGVGPRSIRNHRTGLCACNPTTVEV